MKKLDLDESKRCPSCNCNQRMVVAEIGGFSLVGCDECGLEYLSPRIREEKMLKTYLDDKYYGGGKLGYSDASYLKQRGAFEETFARLIKGLHTKKLTGGRLLEIGCGYGYLLEQARGYFERRIGHEMSTVAAQKARVYGDRVYSRSLEQIRREGRFDLVILTHVLEHIYHPVRFLKDIGRLLKPEGSIVVAVPDAGSVWRRLMGKKWPSYKVPEHVLFFNRKTLGKTLKMAGFVDIKPLSYPHAFPISLVLTKLGLASPKWFDGRYMWLPWTTVALYARRKSADRPVLGAEP